MAARLGTVREMIGRALNTLRTPDALRISVTGNQWWWDVQYNSADPSKT